MSRLISDLESSWVTQSSKSLDATPMPLVLLNASSFEPNLIIFVCEMHSWSTDLCWFMLFADHEELICLLSGK
jgi:hypothetical protein